MLSTIYWIRDFKIVSISVFVLANFLIFLFLLFYLSVFYIWFSPISQKSLPTVFICMYLCLTWYFWYVLYTFWLFYIEYRAIFPLRLVRSILHITYYFCYFTINERLLLKYVYYKHDCLKIFECPGSTIDNIVASSMLIPVRVKPKTITLIFAGPPLSMQNWE